jgi:hypothetical protein
MRESLRPSVVMASDGHNPATVEAAVAVLMKRWSLDHQAAEAALVDMAEDIGVEVNDLAAVIVTAAKVRE